MFERSFISKIRLKKESFVYRVAMLRELPRDCFDKSKLTRNWALRITLYPTFTGIGIPKAVVTFSRRKDAGLPPSAFVMSLQATI